MAEAVYILCAATSLACAVLLFRGYARSRARFLLWSCLCFVALTLNNALLFVDKVVFPDTDLAVAGVTAALGRTLIALVGLSLLLYGLIWDAE
jgi:hypothetical protein